jgi:UDP-glucose 4-epimerase
MADGAETLSGRRVLVTGATGFLGRHLVRALAAAGAEVRPLSVDIRDRAAVAASVAAAAPQLVFHLAAYGTTPIQRDDARMRDVNVGGAEHLWQALDAYPCRIVQTGTCAEYGPASGALTESHPCAPASPYARTVHEAVTMSRDRARRSGRPLVVLRPFGPYGPGDRPERLVPLVIDGLLAGDRVPLTAGAQRRDYSYVDDHVRALVLAATRPLADTARVYNIGGGGPIAVRALVDTIAALVGGSAPSRLAFGALPYRPGDLADVFADVAAARRDLGYEPLVPLADGLARTIAWHRAARAGVA